MTINPAPSITLGTNPAVCSGVTSTLLPYTATTNSPTQYSIDYDGTANGVGFIDISFTNHSFNSGTGNISVSVPAAAAAGTYNGTLTIKTAAGCVSGGYPITVTINANPTVTVNSPAKCANDEAVTITATPDPAVGEGVSYSYLWTVPLGASNPGDVASFTTSVAGLYSVTITRSGSNCQGSGSGTLTVNANPTVSVNSPTKCSNDAAVTITATPNPASGGGVAYSYAWSVPNGVADPGNVASFSASVEGDYSVVVTRTGSNCTGSGSGTLNVNDNPATPSPSNDGPVCAGSALNLSTNAVTDAIYSWTGPNSFVSSSQNPSISSATTAASGTYNLTITVNGCTSGQGSTIATVNAQPLAPTLIITQQPSLCSSSTGTVGVCSPNANYSYSVFVNNIQVGNPQTGASISFAGLAAGSNPVIKVSNGTTGCIATQNCSNAVATCPNPANATRMRTDAYQTTEQQIVVEEPTRVTAYPNPFSNKVRFVVTSPIAGHGNLEVFNMLGQKVKTVYQGLFSSGTQTFELNLPRQQLSNLIYVLRIGDKRMSGKLLQLKQ